MTAGERAVTGRARVENSHLAEKSRNELDHAAGEKNGTDD